ncbi:putative Rho guanyl nucleotide exchange factor [Aspergillus steynii IBT 23096]|uniref:Putative Rho guanyl nucleotide exchange factor n=1 Tax=Aspergillus steynii IBT 23096 TaxID=1392250 RepID=A0A2I2GL89_9EURO|nr:putative Rho guanyl nucleotide exchange factor [Aspergillus steynii IBT 23096]PLB53619.1 putative Rho guanyl nucleotide exchange factor [Aspergillus steynii IBT 23096]
MAHYQNGHPVYGQPNSPSSSAAQPARYASNHNPPLRRMPSYDVGDDAALSAHNARSADAANGQYGAWAAEGYGRADPRYSQLPAATSPQVPRSRGSSHSAYQYQYTSTLASPTQPAYNPQQYAVPSTPSQLGYNPLAYSGSGSSAYAAASAGGSAAAGHQPYNPAAYSQAPPTPLTYPPPHPHLPPPPPPRGTEHPYGGRPPPAGSYGFSAPQSTLPSAYPLGSPSTPSAAYAVGGALAAGGLGSTAYSTGHSPYLPQSPRRSESTIAAAVGDDQPPPPPAHATAGDDPFRKRLSFTRPGSGRSLPTPPTQHSQSPHSPHSPRRAETLTRHPQARPLPGPPVDADAASTSRTNGAGHSPFDDAADDFQAADRPLSGAMRQRIGPLHVDTQHNPFRGDGEIAQHDATGLRLSPDERHTHTNGNMATGTGQYVNYDAYSDDSDAEAAAGLAMLQMADEEEKAQAERLQERSRRETNASIISAYASHPSGGAASPHPDTRPDDGALYGAGYRRSQYGEMGYHRDEAVPAANGPDRDRLMATSGSLRSSNVSSDDRAEYSDDYDYPPVADDDRAAAAYPFQPLPSHARVDAGGTGGLSEPGAYGRRMSFDYGEEAETPPIQHSQHSDSEGSERGDEPEDLFFHPGMRPLPPAPVEPANNARLMPHLMPAGTYRHAEQEDWQSASQYTPSYLPVAADSYRPTVSASSQVPRSTSLSSHPIGPRTDPPIRSKTDADRAKYRQQQQQQQEQELLSLRPESGSLQLDAQTAAAMALDLPTIPAGRRKKFNPTKLSSEQFRRCTEPWALSAVLAWIRELSEDETDLKEQAIVEALVALFTHKVPTMNMADAETLAARVVANMLAEEALVKEEEWVKFGPGSLSGVLFQITGTGCYSSLLHEQEGEAFGRCYSYHCMRTLKKVNLKAQIMEPQKKAEDWVTFYKVPKEVWEPYPKKEIDRQNNLHEVVTTEDSFIGQLDVLRDLYRDQLLSMQPSIIPPKRLNKFLHDVFGKVDSVKRVNEDHLLAQLKYRQKEQGPFIVGFSDIFREWIRKAKSVYVDYAATFPHANYLVRKEAERNIHFRQFLNQARDHKLSNRLSWDTYLKAPITRIQRYTLLLSTVHKNMLKDSEEKANVAQAIEEIKLVALECDNKVGEMSKKVDLMELSSKLQLRPEMKNEVELNLEHLGREIIFRGDLQRPGTRTRFLVDTHAILLDHYLVLAKAVTARDPSRTVKYESYDVSKLPIPMDLLVLESANEDPVVKSSVRGVATVTPPQAATRGTGAVPSPYAAGGTSALVPTTVLENSKDDKILYPFKIKHLGNAGTYILYAFSAQSRQDWCDKITEAKTKHAAALYTQNAEPFRLRVLADTAFANSDFSPSRSVTIDGTPLDRAIKEVELRYPAASPRPQPVCRTAVHCATVFQQPPGRMMCAIGTDYGVYISDYNDPRGWIRAIPIVRVTQIAVFEEFNVLLLIADKSLIAYHLDVVCPASGVQNQTTSDSARRAPQKLSGNREVGFFAAGHMKDRTLVMYKKRDGLSSTFKVMEPVLQKSSSSKTRFFHSRRSQTEFFREFDEFYIPAESYGINMFHSSLAISTQRGIEILTLDKKQTWSVPDFRSEAPEAQAHLTGIATRISNLRPLGMFRLSDSEFLVVYTECAVYVNKHGDVSRSVVMEFVGRSHSACLYGKFLILFNEDFVEVRNAMNGRLRQVIPGHNVVLLDDGSSMPGSGANSVPTSAGGAVNLSSGLSNGGSMASSGRTVKICMQHPEHERSLIILELIENEDQKD